MIDADWSLIGLGALAGALASALFFAGLAWGMRMALRRRHPTPVLLLSAALRMAALMAAGLWVAGQGTGMLAGFALGFLAARLGILLIARRPGRAEGATWN
ncbi:MAG: ATP synthase subunit AtpR [Rhodobacteraceae bacterium]|nr:MAG: ATP synthase subunit AtpR [Paracoccaceae bacterium]